MLTTKPAAPTLRELANLHLKHARVYYRRRSGEPTREHLNFRTTLDRFIGFAGETACPTKINRHQVRAWLDQLAAEKLSRSYINASLGRLRRFVRWASDLDYLPETVAAELRQVRTLPAFRSAAREPAPRLPTRLDLVPLILPFLPAIARDVVQLLMLTGARLGEILEATNADVHNEQHGPRLILSQHKTAHQGRSRVIPLNSRAFAIVQRRSRPLCPLDALFPAPRSKTHAHYNPDALRRAITRACRRAEITHFTPHQLRHAVAALVRDRLGLDAAAAILGHAHVAMTEHYAPLTFDAARRASEVIP